MSVLLLTILGSLLLAGFFVAAFSFDRLSRGRTSSRWQRDSLLPLDDATPEPPLHRCQDLTDRHE